MLYPQILVLTANKIEISKSYFEEAIEKMDFDEDSVFAYNKLVLLVQTISLYNFIHLFKNSWGGNTSKNKKTKIKIKINIDYKVRS